jgi:putative transposase
MPRSGRIVLPGYPHHIVQRGHNSQPVFTTPNDFHYYLDSINQWKEEYGVRLYGYCLMTNHVHLILEPEDARGLADLMKRVAGRQTRRFNRVHERRGTLWEGRFKSSPIDTDAYLLCCCRYVELNPVRAHMVADAEEYSWSSYRERVGLASQVKALDASPRRIGFLRGSPANQSRYIRFVKQGVSDDERLFIKTALQRGQLTGHTDFVDRVQTLTGRRITTRGPGKPSVRKPSDNPGDGVNKSVPFN